MKKKNLDLKKKLVLNKETIANLTPAQQAKLAGGYNQFSAKNLNCNPNPTSDPGETKNYSDCSCTFLTDPNGNCGRPDSEPCGVMEP
jgi:hypothetical protein